MNTIQKTFRYAVVLLALPLIATAVSASQWMYENTPLTVDVDAFAVLSAKDIQFRGHKVALNAAGQIEGRLTVFQDSEVDFTEMKVHLIGDGKVGGTATPAADGTFYFSKVTEGAYSIIATGDNAFAAYGVHVVGEAVADVSSSMEMAMVTPKTAGVRNLISGVSEGVLAENGESDLGSVPIGANRVLLDGGMLTGSVRNLLPTQNSGTAKVHLLKGEKSVAEVETDANGQFQVPDLEPGFYSFLATSQSGFAAISFEAVGSEVDLDAEDVSIEDLPNKGLLGPAPAEVAYKAYAQGDDLDVVLTNGNGYANYIDVVDDTYDPVYTTEFAPIEYVTESIGTGGAYGGTVGSSGQIQPILSRRRRGAIFGGIGGRVRNLGRLGRLAILGGTIGGIIAIADGDDDPEAATNPDPN